MNCKLLGVVLPSSGVIIPPTSVNINGLPSVLLTKPSLARELFQCTFCGEAFNDKIECERHVLQHANRSIPIFQCEQCISSFFSSKKLLKHKKLVHGDFSNGAKKSYRRKSANFRCDACDKVFTVIESLMRHKRKVHDRTRNIFETTEKAFSSALSQTQDTKKKKRRRYECKKCEKTFKSFKGVSKHSKKCTKVHKCDECDKTFSFKASLTVHRNVMHSPDTDSDPGADTSEFICGVCKLKFSSHVELEAHDRTVHTEDKPFNCVICYQSFKTQRHLEIHVELHTGIKPHKCKKCKCLLLLPSDFENHEKEHQS